MAGFFLDKGDQVKLPEPTADFQIAPAGNHRAVCYSVIDLGTQEKQYDGETSFKHEIEIGFELVDEKMEDGRPFVISKRFTFSSSKKSNLIKMLESWRGIPFKPEDLGVNGFDIQKLIGVPCLLACVHVETNAGKNYCVVNAATPMPKGMEKPTLTNPTIYYTISDNSANVWSMIPEYKQNVIMKSPEWQAKTGNVGAMNTQHQNPDTKVAHWATTDGTAPTKVAVEELPEVPF